MRFSFLFTTLLVLTSIFSTAYSQSFDGLYVVTGEDHEMGRYQGFVQIKGEKAIRIVRYSDLNYLGNAVETIWEGQLTGKVLSFSLKPNATLTQFNDFKISAEEMNQIQTAETEISLDQPMRFFAARESWTLFDVDPGSDPLWKNLRTKINTNGNRANFILRVANALGIRKIIASFYEMAAQSRWGKTSDFLNKQHWLIFDPTDYDFYQTTPNVIRIENKTVNALSLAEATMRKNAYGKKLSEKAQYFEDETLKYNLNSAGMLEVALVNEAKEKIKGEVEYDSTLWTGVYIWSQVLRYKQTNDPQAYKNIKSGLNGILTLLEITENPNQFARTLLVSPSSDKLALGGGLVQGRGKFSDLKWQQVGNNDMSKGLFISLTSAYSVLKKEDIELKSRIAKATFKLSKFDPIKNRGFNKGIANGLIALYNNDVSYALEFSRSMVNAVNLLVDAFDLDSGFYYESIADWSGIHLSAISALSQLLLATELESIFSKDSQVSYQMKLARKSAEERLLEMSDTYRNAHRDFLTIMTYAFSPKARSSKEFSERAKQALWSLREIPAPRFIGKGVVDHTMDSSWSISAWPKMPWKSIKGVGKINSEKMTFQNHMQGAYMYPLFESLAWTTTYFWKDTPYRTVDTGHENKIFFSADYLLIYRIAVQSGLINSQE